ncbi:MAG: hypothetical protein FD161_415 [Limisphaerales bacterium]|nr:MAG: hypothetical protein FD161_415 [Limisphaerales bacterium]KAG0510320.1 MAG: hypothetical protein E1N63_415 [Limisphaerales bacterium]TXT51507.1 MAG: hypothetical protein FD140_1545 [Limisphaerales bacterium]
MKSDIAKFVALRNSLLQERARIQARLAEIGRALGASAPAASVAATPTGRRTFSAATKAKMAAAQKARWAKRKGGTPAPAAAPKKAKRKLSAAGRAAIVAAAKARWAKVKAGK